jgi:hypothetical protein
VILVGDPAFGILGEIEHRHRGHRFASTPDTPQDRLAALRVSAIDLFDLAAREPAHYPTGADPCWRRCSSIC